MISMAKRFCAGLLLGCLLLQPCVVAEQQAAVDPHALSQAQLREQEQWAIVYRLLGSTGVQEDKDRVLLDESAIFDLELVNRASLLNKINRTSTAAGYATLARMLLSPVYNIAELQRRQTVVKKLIENEELFSAADQALRKFKTLEPSLIGLFSQKNEYEQAQLQTYYFRDWLKIFGMSPDTINKKPHLLLGADIMEKYLQLSLPLQIRDRIKERLDKQREHTINGHNNGTEWLQQAGLWALPFGCVLAETADNDTMRMFAGSLVGVGALYTAGSTYSSLRIPAYREALKNRIWHGDSLLGKIKNVAMGPLEKVNELHNYLIPASMCLSLYYVGKNAITQYKLISRLRAQCMKFSLTLAKLKDAAQVVEASDILKNLPEVQALADLAQHPEHFSKDFNALQALLQKGTFKSTWGLYYGRTLAANKLIQASRQDFATIIQAIGILDAYVSIAKLMKESTKQRVKFCFADYRTSDKPYLALNNCWSPLIPADKVVANSLELGNPVRNMIISGPNTGGKSTVLKTVAINVILAQSLGIAAAQSCTLTPFATINTSANIIDQADGDSFFAAECQRALELSKRIKALKPGTFSISFIDELFRGTTDDQADVLAYTYTKDELGSLPQSLTLQATHKRSLRKLAQEVPQVFANYKVDVELLPGNKIKYLYTLQPGWSTQKIGHLILQNKGLLTPEQVAQVQQAINTQH